MGIYEYDTKIEIYEYFKKVNDSDKNANIGGNLVTQDNKKIKVKNDRKN